VDAWRCPPSTIIPAQILGRASVDIIKSGGYKLSALDIESTLSRHPQVRTGMSLRDLGGGDGRCLICTFLTA
jgi:acyl-CoA synthetase (AMP-forming)/AMP-acid ligase II